MRSLDTRDLAPGDVLLYSGNGILSRLIEVFDESEVSHAGLYLGDGQVAEALAVKDHGLHRHSLEESVRGSNWVDVRRLSAEQHPAPILRVAERYAWQGNRYAYGQILMLAVICLTRKIRDQGWLAQRIAERTLRAAAAMVNLWRSENREPMICSEFVYRTYDEANPEATNDPYSLEILSQQGSPAIRSLSFRRRHAGDRSSLVQNSPTVHPDSILARISQQPSRFESQALTAAIPVAEPSIEAEIEELGRQLLEGEVRAFSRQEDAVAAGSSESLESAAAEFASALADSADPAKCSEDGRFRAESLEAESAVDRLARIVADFVTPGDLHVSPSLKTVGRLSE